jgi:Sec-independent protein translocase protein TatA
LANINHTSGYTHFIWRQKIRTMGSDLGEGLKGFKKAIKDDVSAKDTESKSDDQ